ncbi:hypothetical protein KZZ20_05905 [Methylacidiphilum fumariolicum]|uniref:hypothetical protein n=1 Tax=Candidatus Methylacidiphilum fumarolicum TaxID=591154 RepID=UPI000A8625C2|nr:hypothetical protein [Candidatus Methylacidiphilum fumarolicum]MBW6415047.1 hypothetical protein [Candidatus Methylacidiphilum fumarolicum]TFE77968.1 hypothetical protein A7D33_00165 [Candidatus Methylacidiphilum fumarolicum]
MPQTSSLDISSCSREGLALHDEDFGPIRLAKLFDPFEAELDQPVLVGDHDHRRSCPVPQAVRPPFCLGPDKTLPMLSAEP